MIVRTIIELDTSLGLRTIAEGIETPGLMSCLLALGCEQGQGYVFGKPIPGEAFRSYLEDRRQDPQPRKRTDGLAAAE